ncbi:MAG: protein kinase [Polyangiaceae bacterium]|nr:protein kinase [Polyangiaceae bacterium]
MHRSVGARLMRQTWGTWSRVRPLHRQTRAVLVGIGGLLVTAALVYAIHQFELGRARAQFDRQARDIRTAVEANLATPLESLRALPPFFAASESIERDEFAAFVDSALRRQPGIAYVAWAPEIEEGERTELEARAKEAGWPNFEIRAANADATGARAGVHPAYLPIVHVEPRDDRLLGLDVIEDPIQEERAKEALTTGRVTSAPGFSFRGADSPIVAVYAPLTRRARTSTDPRVPRRGLAVLGLRVAPIVRASVDEEAFHGLDIVVTDESAPPERQLLFESSPAASTLSPEEADAESTQHLSFGGSDWALRVVARPGTIKAGAGPFAVAGLGVLLSFATMIALGSLEVVRRLRSEVGTARQLGQYRLVRKLGEGGMGVVYEAEHALLRRPTAVKVIAPYAGGRDVTERFEREVKATSELTHPNTILVYDYGRTPEGVFYYAMEFLHGTTLDDLVRTVGPLSASRVLHILKQVCGSLAEAHQHGLVHRDIKPGNIMVCERGTIMDFVKVLDFGLVKHTSTSGVPRLSQAGYLLGTPPYMAPEALRGETEVTQAVDIYAVGAVAYYCLTGCEVFEAASLTELLGHHIHDEPVPPSARSGRAIPADFEAVIMRCLAKRPGDRPRSAEELLSMFEACRVPEWTQADAKQFWREHGAELERAPVEPSEDIALCATLAVDLEQREPQPAYG